MEDKLVSFKTAKVAKEKGFDWECSNYFQDSSRAGVFKIDSINNRTIDELHVEDSGCVIFYAVPTQSLLQRWLREKYKIFINVEINSNEEYRVTVFKIIIAFKDTFNRATFDNNQYSESRYKTYEEALEKGLQEALKLIK